MNDFPDIMKQLDDALTGWAESLPEPQKTIFKATASATAQREKELVATVQKKCAASLQEISSALLFPRVSALELETAVMLLQEALKAARELDQ